MLHHSLFLRNKLTQLASAGELALAAIKAYSSTFYGCWLSPSKTTKASSLPRHSPKPLFLSPITSAEKKLHWKYTHEVHNLLKPGHSVSHSEVLIFGRSHE